MKPLGSYARKAVKMPDREYKPPPARPVHRQEEALPPAHISINTSRHETRDLRKAVEAVMQERFAGKQNAGSVLAILDAVLDTGNCSNADASMVKNTIYRIRDAGLAAKTLGAGSHVRGNIRWYWVTDESIDKPETKEEADTVVKKAEQGQSKGEGEIDAELRLRIVGHLELVAEVLRELGTASLIIHDLKLAGKMIKEG
jgi:hypothetical protein